jgi:hypothetical protein
MLMDSYHYPVALNYSFLIKIFNIRLYLTCCPWPVYIDIKYSEEKDFQFVPLTVIILLLDMLLYVCDPSGLEG